MKKVKRADCVLWLAEMKQKGSTRLKDLRQQFADGDIQRYELDTAQHKQDTITLLLAIFQACQLEPDELLEMMKGLKQKGRGQASLFVTPKNPI